MSVELDHAIGFSGGVPGGLCVFPDGDSYASAVGACVVIGRLRDPSDQCFLRGHAAQVCALALSPSGRLLASGQAGPAGDIIVWDAGRRDIRFRLEEHDGQVTALAFSDDDRVLASAATDGVCVFWDLVTGAVIARQRAEQSPTLALQYGGYVVDVKGREAAVYQWSSAGAKSASVWGLDPASGSAAAERLTAPGLVRDFICAVSSPGPRHEWLYLGSANGDLCVLHLASRTLSSSAFVAGGGVCSLRVAGTAPSGVIILLAGCGDGSVLVYRHTPPQAETRAGRDSSYPNAGLSALTPHVASAVAGRMGVGTGEGRSSSAALALVGSVTVPGAVWSLGALTLSESSVSFLAATSAGELYTVTGATTSEASALAAAALAPAAYGRRAAGGSLAPPPAAAPQTSRAGASDVVGRGLTARLVLQAHGAGREGASSSDALPSALAAVATGASTSGLPQAMVASLRACDAVSVAFVAGGTSDRFVTCASDNTVRVWDTGNLHCVNTTHVKGAGHPTCVLFAAPDFSISGWQDGSIRAHLTAPPPAGAPADPVRRRREGVSDADPGQLWCLPDSHHARAGGVSTLIPAGNQRFFLSGGGDGVVRLWDSRSRELVSHLKEHTASVTGLAIYRDDVHVASVSRDRSLLVWDLRREKRVSQHSQRTGGLNAVALARDQSLVLTAGQEGSVAYWDLREPAPVNSAPACSGAGGEVTTIAVAHAHDVFITGGTDSMLRLWDLRTARPLAECSGHSGALRQVVFSPDDRQVVSVGADGAILLWNVFL